MKKIFSTFILLIFFLLTGCGAKDTQEVAGGMQTFVPVATVEPTPEPTPAQLPLPLR